jgi:hypothetical protein
MWHHQLLRWQEAAEKKQVSEADSWGVMHQFETEEESAVAGSKAVVAMVLLVEMQLRTLSNLSDESAGKQTSAQSALEK